MLVARSPSERRITLRTTQNKHRTVQTANELRVALICKQRFEPYQPGSVANGLLFKGSTNGEPIPIHAAESKAFLQGRPLLLLAPDMQHRGGTEGFFSCNDAKEV